MTDLSKFENTIFYAGKPTVVRVDELVWKDHEYEMAVRTEGMGIVAIMRSGNCEWRTAIDAADPVTSIDAALEDACNLGRAANYSPDPER